MSFKRYFHHIAMCFLLSLRIVMYYMCIFELVSETFDP